MFLVFQAVFAWSRPPMEWIQAGVEGLRAALGGALPESALKSLLLDGVLAGVGSVLLLGLVLEGRVITADALLTHAADGPLAWFAVHDAPLPWPEGADGGAGDPPAQVTWTDSPDRATFDAALAQIQQAIAAGELYQVNHTAPIHGTLQGSAPALFAALLRAQPGGYAAHIDTGGADIACPAGCAKAA